MPILRFFDLHTQNEPKLIKPCVEGYALAIAHLDRLPVVSACGCLFRDNRVVIGFRCESDGKKPVGNDHRHFGSFLRISGI